MRISDWSSDVCSSDLLVRPKMLDDLVERAGHGIERRKLLDHPIPCCQGRFALDRVALRIEGRARAQIAFIIRVGLIKLGREGMLQIGADEIGRATGREKGGQYVEISVVAGLLK